ncbi:MAG: PmoA family protein [Massilibacteroides sp.]|nr:PmoA family protein [Massilibacteroides sp.]
MMIKQFLSVFMLAAFFMPSIITKTQAQEKANVSATKVGKRIDVVIDGKFFTSYRFEDDEKYPFFFPVNGLSQASVTSMRNGVYPHHTSLWLACDKVNGGNYWQEGLDRGRIISTGAQLEKASGESIIIKDQCIWKRPGAPAPIVDTRLITISCPNKEYYQIDFDIEMKMLIDVTILRTNHSLFSARIDPDLTVKRGGHMVNANGDQTEVGTFGVNSPWIDCYGERNNVAAKISDSSKNHKHNPGNDVPAITTEGIAILQHPSNSGFPSKWFTRDYGFMSPTPMYWPTKGDKTEFKKDQVLKLRYRVIVHKGDSKQAKIAQLFELYKNQ